MPASTREVSRPDRTRRRRSGAALVAATVVAMTATMMVTVAGPAAAAPTSECAWLPAAQQLWTALAGVDDPRAEGIRSALAAVGVGDATVPAACETAAPAPEEAPRGLPLHGSAQLGILDPTAGTGQVITVDGGDIGAADPRPGDVVEIAGGTYPAFTPKSGAEGAWVTYRPAPGAQVVISGGGAEGRGLVELGAGTSWVHLADLVVRDSPGFGIHAEGASHIALTGVEVDGAQDGGIVVQGSDNVHVEGCDVHGTNARGTKADHEAISMADGTDTFEVFNCQVHGNGEEGIDSKNESVNGVVHHNLVWGNRGPNLYVDSTGGPVTVEDNYAWGATHESKPGILLAVENYSQRKLLANVTVRRNTVWGNAGGGIKGWMEGSGTIEDVLVADNVLAGGDRAEPFAGISLSGNVEGAVPAMPAGFVGQEQ